MPRFRILILILLFIPGFVFASGEKLDIYSNVSTANVGDTVSVSVRGSTGPSTRANKVTIYFDNGVIRDFPCDNSGIISACPTSGYHISNIVYDHPGTYIIKAQLCFVNYMVGGDDCIEDTVAITIENQGTVLVCDPIICDGVCQPLCTVDEDPDCGCKSGDGCCGRGCGPINDSDCTSASGFYDNPIKANDIVQFIWQVVYFVFTGVIYLTALFILIGAYVLVTSGGNITKVALGKKIIIFTLIGFVIAYTCRGIMALTLSFLGD